MKNVYLGIVYVVLVFALAAQPVLAQGAGEDCGNPYDSRGGGGGPHDYYNPAKKEAISLVVNAHFSPYMEDMAIYGSSARVARRKEEKAGGRELIAGNLDYTLRAIPNNPRALYAMAMWQLRMKNRSLDEYTKKRAAWKFKSSECYFQRAMMFKPQDGMVHMVYAIYLSKAGFSDKAVESYKQSIALMPNASEAHYNLGLLYVERGQYSLALEQAQKAYDLGYPLPGLRNELVRRGEWVMADSSTDSAAR